MKAREDEAHQCRTTIDLGIHVNIVVIEDDTHMYDTHMYLTTAVAVCSLFSMTLIIHNIVCMLNQHLPNHFVSRLAAHHGQSTIGITAAPSTNSTNIVSKSVEEI